MADNYLEKKMDALQARKAKEQRAKQLAWKKRMEAYRRRLEAAKLEEFAARPVKDENILNASEAAAADSACAKGQEGSASQE